MKPCRECGGYTRHHLQCPDYEEPGGPEADEDERGGEYDYDDEDPTVIDCWKMLDGVWEAREKRHG